MFAAYGRPEGIDDEETLRNLLAFDRRGAREGKVEAPPPPSALTRMGLSVMFVSLLDRGGGKEGRIVTQPTSPPSGSYVRANGLEIYYEEHGRGEEPLILVHGGLITGMINWGPSIPDFEEYFRIIVPDSRLYG